jgi:hypothetical protein
MEQITQVCNFRKPAMKNYILLILLFCANTCWANALDKVKTKQDLYKFLSRHIGWDAREWLFGLDTTSDDPPVSKHVGTDSFYIADIDKNGFNDLIIDSRSFYIFMGKRHNKFEFFSMGKMTVKYTYLGIREKDSTNQLLVKIERLDRSGGSTTYDTALIYRDNSFIEYVDKPSTHSIDRINYRFGGGWDSETYTVSVDSTHADYKRLSKLLNGIRFTELSDQYEDIISDMTFSTLVIYFDGGKEKTIHDYGHIGPLGLIYLNKQLDAIHERGQQ